MITSSTAIFTYADPPTAVAVAAVGTDPPSDTVSGIQALSVLFDGAASNGDAAITYYSWNFGDGSGTYGPDRAITRHTYYPAGVYAAVLTVTDSFGQTATDTVSVTVGEDTEHDDPVAVITASPNSGTAPLPVSFSAVDSTVWSEITRVSWDFGDGSTSSYANPYHTFSPHSAGTTTYTVTLTVYTIYGRSNSTTTTINVGYTEIQIPTITSISPTEGQEAGGTSIIVNGEDLLTVSSARFVNRSNGQSFIVTDLRVYSDTQISLVSPPGVGICDLVLSSYAGSSVYPRSASTFEYKDGPSALATVSNDNITFGQSVMVEPGDTVYFSSAGSATGVTYLWDFGDGTIFNFGDMNTSNAANPTHEFRSEGSFTVTLTVTDSNGLSGFDSVRVVVRVPPTGNPGGGGGGSNDPNNWWGGHGGGGGGGGWGGTGGPPFTSPPGTPSQPLFTDVSCEVTGKATVFAPKFVAAWTTYRRSDHVQFDATVTITTEFNAYAAFIGAISTRADGNFPATSATGSTVGQGYGAATASITGGNFPNRANIVLNSLFTQRLFAPGATVATGPSTTFFGGVLPVGTVFRMRVRAPLDFEVAFASLGFLDSSGLNVTGPSYAYVKTNCSEDLTAGWSVGFIRAN